MTDKRKTDKPMSDQQRLNLIDHHKSCIERLTAGLDAYSKKWKEELSATTVESE